MLKGKIQGGNTPKLKRLEDVIKEAEAKENPQVIRHLTCRDCGDYKYCRSTSMPSDCDYFKAPGEDYC